MAGSHAAGAAPWPLPRARLSGCRPARVFITDQGAHPLLTSAFCGPSRTSRTGTFCDGSGILPITVGDERRIVPAAVRDGQRTLPTAIGDERPPVPMSELVPDSSDAVACDLARPQRVPNDRQVELVHAVVVERAQENTVLQ